MEERTIRLDEINFRLLCIALLKNTWVVILLCVSVLLGYNAVTKITYEPRYTSSATFMVSAKDGTNAYNSLTTTQSMASVFVEVFQSNVLREKIQAEMGDETFTGAISTKTIPETNLLIVTVTSPTPVMSFKGMNLIVENYSTISDYVFANAQLEVIKSPVVPTTPSNPMDLTSKRSLIICIAAVLGYALVGVMWIMRDTVQTPNAAKRKIDARLLRTIRHEEKNKTLRSKLSRKNNAPLVTNPLITKSFMEDNLNLCSTLEYHMRRRNQKVILVTSAGENEGKSTVAANLAILLAERNKKVALLDCDFRKPSLNKIFETPVSKENNITQFILGKTNDLVSCLTYLKKYDITIGMASTERSSISELINNGRLKILVEKLRESFDYIIIDTPPMLAATDAEAISKHTDTSFMVTRMDYMPVKTINDALDRLYKNAPEVCGLVLNNNQKNLF